MPFSLIDDDAGAVPVVAVSKAGLAAWHESAPARERDRFLYLHAPSPPEYRLINGSGFPAGPHEYGSVWTPRQLFGRDSSLVKPHTPRHFACQQ